MNNLILNTLIETKKCAVIVVKLPGKIVAMDTIFLSNHTKLEKAFYSKKSRGVYL